MQQPLLVSSLLVHAARHDGDAEVVPRRVEGGCVASLAATWRGVRDDSPTLSGSR